MFLARILWQVIVANKSLSANDRNQIKVVDFMARNQYSYAKRQRDLAKQKKKEEKRLRKLAKNKNLNVEDNQTGDEEDRWA